MNIDNFLKEDLRVAVKHIKGFTEAKRRLQESVRNDDSDGMYKQTGEVIYHAQEVQKKDRKRLKEIEESYQKENIEVKMVVRMNPKDFMKEVQ